MPVIANLPEQPDGHVRCIRYIEVPRQDLYSLLVAQYPQNRVALRSATINAYAAALQEDCEGDGAADFVVFSSLLGPTVRGTFGTGRSTIRAWVLSGLGCTEPKSNTHARALLASKCRWAIPLRSYQSETKHWVFVELRLDTRQIILRDSIRGSGAESWAVDTFIHILKSIHDEFDLPPFRPEQYQSRTVSPSKANSQHDGWSSGLFTLMYIRAFASNTYDDVQDSQKFAVATSALERLLKLPLVVSSAIVEAQVVDNSAETTSSEPRRAPEDAMEIDSTGTDPDSINTEPPSLPVPVQSENGSLAVVWASAAALEAVKATTRAIPKRSRPSPGSDSEGYDTDASAKRRRLHSIRSEAASGSRAPKSNPTHRHAAMLSDTRIREIISPGQVVCNGCGGKIKLHKSRLYEIENFNKHVARCRGITGVHQPKKAKNAINAPTKNVTIDSMFRRKSETAHASTSASSLSPPPVVPAPKALPGPSTLPQTSQPALPIVICPHLSGPEWTEYVLRTRTRNFGGIGPTQRILFARQLFRYKAFPATKALPEMRPSETVPDDGNAATVEGNFTETELRALDDYCAAHARWIVDVPRKYIKATGCSGMATDPSGLSDECAKLLKDDGLRRSVNRKNNESKLPESEQHTIQISRDKFSSTLSSSADERRLQLQLRDPLFFKLWSHLERGKSTECFLHLYQQAAEGKLKDSSTFTELCQVLSERVRRDNSTNTKLKHGMRYPQNYLNFMTLMRSYGGNSARQFAIMTGELAGPSPRTMKALVANSVDALQNPSLVLENVARVKRLADALSWNGPIVKAGDCTKVRPRLAYSNHYGGHVLGSILPLQDCEVDTPADIDLVIAKIKSAKATASQCCAILLQIPDPRAKPIVVALLPANGTDDGRQIHELDMQLLGFCEHLGLKLLAIAADGASSEVKAMQLMYAEKTSQRLTYTNTEYGVHLSAPVFDSTGPLICVTDPDHARKTMRNQPQYGTHTASMGSSCIVNRSLVQLYEQPDSGLVQRDVKNTDKQDDGAARRSFHERALRSMTVVSGDGDLTVKDEFRGLFVFLSCFGLLFDAWTNRKMSHLQRIICAFRARFLLHIWAAHIDKMAARFPDLYSRNRSFISPQSFNILNMACDSLVLLIIAHEKYYPNVPFCPWLYGPPFVEHFFGILRMFLPNFTYSEMLVMTKHAMVRQTILLSGKFKDKREKISASGYDLDYDSSTLSPEDIARLTRYYRIEDVDRAVAISAKEASAMSTALLDISSPNRPWQLAPLCTPTTRRRPRRNVASADASDMSDDSSDSGSDLEPDDDEDTVLPVDDDIEPTDISSATATAALDTARYTALCNDLDSTLDALSPTSDAPPPLTPPASMTPPASIATASSSATQLLETAPPLAAASELRSAILNDDGTFSVAKMVSYRREMQTGTRVHSERVVTLDPKFELAQFQRDGLKEAYTMKPQEASQRVRIAQDTDSTIVKPKTSRELRWTSTAAKLLKALPVPALLPDLVSRNVTAVHALQPGCFVIMKTELRVHIGRVLDMYVRGESKRHNSVDQATATSTLSYLSLLVYLPVTRSDQADDEQQEAQEFSCKYGRSNIYTHASAKSLLYNLGLQQLVGSQLTAQARTRWDVFNGVSVPAFKKILIPGGKAKKSNTRKSARKGA